MISGFDITWDSVVHQWREVFNGSFAERAVKVELGEGISLRVTTTNRNTGQPVMVEGPNPYELKKKLIDEQVFTEQEINDMIREIMHR